MATSRFAFYMLDALIPSDTDRCVSPIKSVCFITNKEPNPAVTIRVLPSLVSPGARTKMSNVVSSWQQQQKTKKDKNKRHKANLSLRVLPTCTTTRRTSRRR